MDTAALITAAIAVTIEFVVGIALNICILLVYIGNLRNGLSLGPSDKIHLTKALVNVSLDLIMAAQNIICVFWPYIFFMNGVFRWNGMINTFLIFYSYWLTTMLCVYYCTNITNSGHRFFVWLKKSLSSYLLPIHLLVGLGLVAVCILVFWNCDLKPVGNSTYQSMIIRPTALENVRYKTASSILGCFLPFTIAFVSTAFTSWSLINHMWRMKQNNPGFTRSKFQTQINAIRTMILFFLISFIYNVTQMFFINMPDNTSDAVVIMIWFVIIFYPISEAVIIIQSSSKLRKTFLKKFFNRKRKNSEAETENQEVTHRS